LFGALAARSWLAELPVAAPVGVPVQAESLPMTRPSEARLNRARALHAEGRPHEALALLGAIDVADPFRPDADRLTADIQRGLLAGVAPTAAPVEAAR
jgi:hypothetical protein